MTDKKFGIFSALFLIYQGISVYKVYQLFHMQIGNTNIRNGAEIVPKNFCKKTIKRIRIRQFVKNNCL